MPENGYRPSILLVEDDPLARQQMSEFLLDAAGLLLTAADGEQGLALYRERRPDIVVTDVLMPAMNGLEMARRIRALAPDAQIVILTACNDLDDFGPDACLPAHYLWKPVDIEKLFRVIRQCTRTAASAVRPF